MTSLKDDPEFMAAYERGVQRAVKALDAGKSAADKAEEVPAPTPKVKKVTVRDDKLKKCPVCFAPSLDSVSGSCMMVRCETYTGDPL